MARIRGMAVLTGELAPDVKTVTTQMQTPWDRE